MTLRVCPLPFVDDPLVYFDHIRHLPSPVLLDSNQPASQLGRFDIMAAAPDCLVKVTADQCHVDFGSGFTTSNNNPLELVSEQLKIKGFPKAIPTTLPQHLPFYGGALGLFGYDYGRQLEVLPCQAEADISVPDLWIGLYVWAVVVDHQEQQVWLVSSLPSDQHQDLLQSLASMAANNKYTISTGTSGFTLVEPFVSNMTESEYLRKFNTVQDYISAGDCYQVCLAQRFKARYIGDAWQAYKQLRAKAPTPFSGYIQTDAGTVMSLSPERFLKVKNKQVETRPIKGTRPRGNTEVADQALHEELINSAKDRAENLMIVDLLRNDLSKHCLPHSVKVPRLFGIESYRNVHHMVSTIIGEIASPADVLPLLRDAFPGGSITGAPKIRAMEIIDELEPQRRNAYTGAMGYISIHGDMDTNILIRTLVTDSCTQEGNLYCWAGGGLVADSEAKAEYQETFDKVNNLLSSFDIDRAQR